MVLFAGSGRTESKVAKAASVLAEALNPLLPNPPLSTTRTVLAPVVKSIGALTVTKDGLLMLAICLR